MSARVANCPNCGGQVEFKADTSLLSVCPYCSSAVARRGDDLGELEITGQVAPLMDLGSPLSLGLEGSLEGRSFRLIGRTQLDWGNGPWNEWYAAFDDGRWGWVAEAQGRVYLTRPTAGGALPRFHQARVGLRFDVPGGTLVVTERRRARLVAAEGELPFAAVPGSSYGYCDAEGAGGLFATIDYGSGEEEATLFLGKEYGYEALFGRHILGERQAGRAQGEALNCPNCAAPLELRAPDSAQRVTCTSCEALLDCERGTKLQVLDAVRRPAPEPLLPLGQKGKLRGRAYTVYGMLVRSVSVDGVRYPWHEYLLRDEAEGAFRWLVVADGHLSFVTPISAGEVEVKGRSARYQGQSFRFFQGGTARVEALRGEFYWKVSLVELAATADYVAPPRMLSRESSDEEIVWSIGEYLEHAEVEQAFGLKKALPRKNGIAPHQPNPVELKPLFKLGLALSALFLLLAGVLWIASANELLLQASLPITTDRVVPPATRGQVVVTEPFEVRRKSNLELRFEAPVVDGYVFFDGALVSSDRAETRPFGVLAESLGGGRKRVYLGEVPAGTYVIRATPEWGGTPPLTASLEVRRGVFRPTHLALMLCLLWGWPVLLLFQSMSFEKNRWAMAD